MSAITIDQAIEVFVRGFAFTRSFTFPYMAERLDGGVWVVRDADRKRGDYRTEEYVAHGVPADAMDAIARRHTRGRYRLCVVRATSEDDRPIRAAFKSAGYRLMATEAFMVHDLQRIEEVAEPVPIVRIGTAEEADRLAKASGSRKILPEMLAMESRPMRQYAAMDGEKPVGWVGSVAAAGYAWCNSMFVEPAYRRRGIATALLSRMLLDDRESGAWANVLLASHVGSKLYPTVGYEEIGELLILTPVRQKG